MDYSTLTSYETSKLAPSYNWNIILFPPWDEQEKDFAIGIFVKHFMDQLLFNSSIYYYLHQEDLTIFEPESYLQMEAEVATKN